MPRLTPFKPAFQSDRTAFRPLVQTAQTDCQTDILDLWSGKEGTGALSEPLTSPGDYRIRAVGFPVPPCPLAAEWEVALADGKVDGTGRGIRFRVVGHEALVQVGLDDNWELTQLDEAIAACGLSWGLLSGGLVLHSSAVVWNGRTHLFLGPSGIGKTTLALWASDHGAELLSVDQTLVRPSDSASAWEAVSCDAGARNRVTVGSISVLCRGSLTRRTRMGLSHAVRAVLPNVLLWKGASGLHSLVLERTVALMERVPVYELTAHLPSLSMEEVCGG